ncbi:helix-turn-helix domain-containing protein [Desulforamulus putei]|uniref:helix-turn-helix domain-containing protein n=1 Tax=Desulforamulus putei TaxID=74701 RepID=UPI00093524B3
MAQLIGDRLRCLRHDTGLSVYQLKELTGLSHETIRCIENNKSIPRVSTALRLAKLFCVSPGVFLIVPNDFYSEKLTVRFKNLRYMLGLKQNEFADLCGLDPSVIRNWELGVTEPNRQSRYYIETILELCKGR